MVREYLYSQEIHTEAFSIMYGTHSEMIQKKMCACVCVYICIYVHTHTHIYEKRVHDKANGEIFTTGKSQ